MTILRVDALFKYVKNAFFSGSGHGVDRRVAWCSVSSCYYGSSQIDSEMDRINCERGYCHWNGKIYKAVHDRLTKKGYLVTKRFYVNSDSDTYDWKESRTEWSITGDGFYKGKMPPDEWHRSRKIITIRLDEGFGRREGCIVQLTDWVLWSC